MKIPLDLKTLKLAWLKFKHDILSQAGTLMKFRNSVKQTSNYKNKIIKESSLDLLLSSRSKYSNLVKDLSSCVGIAALI